MLMQGVKITCPRTHIGPRNLTRDPQYTYDLIKIQPLSPLIGAEIDGINLHEPISAEVAKEIRQALLEWKVIFFRDQHEMTLDDQVTLAKLWGELETPHPFYPNGEHGVVRLVKDSATPGTENMWHSDVTWKEIPPKVVVLRIKETPPYGGDTLWADTQAVYDNLPENIRTKIADMRAWHDWSETFGTTITEDLFNSIRADYPAVTHPVVRTHPESGRKGIYVNIDFTNRIDGLPEKESTELLNYLYAQIATPEYQVRLHWAPNTVAIWDNIATQHYACCDYFPNRRVGERVSIEGDARPV